MNIKIKQFLEVASTFVARLVLTAILITPIAIYIRNFGFTITSDHARWAEMGSAMSGIYGPILALLAFAVLIQQAKMQGESNKHMFDQSHIQQAENDVSFYLTRLEGALAKIGAGTSQNIGERLVVLFAHTTIEQLREEHEVLAAILINGEHSQLFAAWAAFQSIAAGLEVSKEPLYSKSLSSAKQRAIVVLSYEMCVALDNYTWCMAGGNLRGPFLFSSLPLRQEQ